MLSLTVFDIERFRAINDAYGQSAGDEVLRTVARRMRDVVGDVQQGSKAWESGLRQGDVITRVGNEAVTSPQQAERAIRAAQRDNKEHVAIAVKRDGSTRFLGLQLAG